ncbi:hypothetical protein [Microbacterium sp. C7(2022)]|uniref:hypothetical protein n=1 Tax=Microbacterium sp. C7(2022) TaxID=2992759 RepID=UPI00237C1D93|nr:hypothetical protein [Microbacterium sp. C7(2022)]MDE0546119.1 hypothetical protein [Microbacterium sp. C7(2022)]
MRTTGPGARSRLGFPRGYDQHLPRRVLHADDVGEPFHIDASAAPDTLIRADLVDAVGVRGSDESVTGAVLLDDGAHLGVGYLPVSDPDPAWIARSPLHGAEVQDDGGETWFVALQIDRTTRAAGGFTSLDLTYEVDGRQHAVPGTPSFSFPAIGDACPD